MIKKNRTLCGVALVCVASLLCSSCKSVKVSPVVAALDGIALASTTAIGIVAALELSGRIDVATGQVVVDFAKWANQKAQLTITEWQGTDTREAKISAAIGYWSDPPNVPANLAAGLSATVQTILAAINQFKRQLSGSQTLMASHTLTVQQSQAVDLDVKEGLRGTKKKFAELQKKIEEVEKLKK